MSRVGKVPITIPSGIEVKIEGSRVTVKGPKGQLSRDLNPDMKLNLSDGVLTVARPGIEFEVEGTARVIVRGINKEDVGQTAADVRKVRPPEPYKGKGIRYLGEYVRRKAGKAGKG